MSYDLLFDELSLANAARAEEWRDAAGGENVIEDWSPTDLGCALSGEVGELCNLLKKIRRGDKNISLEDIADELADVVIYADILAQNLDIKLSNAIQEKFNKTSQKLNLKTELKISFFNKRTIADKDHKWVEEFDLHKEIEQKTTNFKLK